MKRAYRKRESDYRSVLQQKFNGNMQMLSNGNKD